MKRLTLKQFIGILDKYRPSGWLLFIALVLSIIQTGISLIIPLVSMELVDLLVVEEFNIFTLLGLLLLLCSKFHFLVFLFI